MEKLKTLSQLLTNAQTEGGTWKIDDNHDLTYKARGSKKEVTIDTTLVAAEPGALIFSYTDKLNASQSTTRLFKLEGKWALDKKNRITFKIEREKGKTNVLTFKSGWQVSDNHQIIYSYEKKFLKTKTKVIQELEFKGRFDVTAKSTLSFYVGADTENVFHIKGTFESKSLLAKNSSLRYQLGVEVMGKKKTQTITLFGKWILTKDLMLTFEIEYDQGEKCAITFGAQYNLTDKRCVSAQLKTQDGASLGIELVLTQDIFKDGSAFIRLCKSLEDSRAEAGMSFKF